MNQYKMILHISAIDMKMMKRFNLRSVTIRGLPPLSYRTIAPRARGRNAQRYEILHGPRTEFELA